MAGRRRWILLAVSALAAASLAAAEPPQRVVPKEGGKGFRGRPLPPPGRKALGRPGARENMFDHLMSLSPEDQGEFLRNSPRFRRLPPQQQERIRRRLEDFNRMPEPQREALRERYELFRQMPPERQDRARALYRQWNRYGADRRQELMREFRQLRDATPDERRARMEGEEFRNRYSESEQEVLKGLVDLLPEPEPE